MKKTKEDDRFAMLFAEALQPHIDLELASGKSLTKIAKGLGVTGWGLQKQLGGGTPSIRTVALAYALYGVSVPYQGIPFTKALSKKRRARQSPERQLLLPFEIMTPAPANRVTLKLLPRGVRKYQLRLSVRVTS